MVENVKQIVIDINKDQLVDSITFHHMDETNPLMIDYSHHPLRTKRIPEALASLMKQKEKVDGCNETENNKRVAEEKTSA